MLAPEGKVDEHSKLSSPANPICPGCGSYVHRYIERCPVCALDRPGGLRRAAAAWATIGSSADALEAARVDAADVLSDAEHRFRLASKLVLRYQGGLPGHRDAADVQLALDTEHVTLTETRFRQAIARIHPSDVLAAIPTSDRTSSREGWQELLNSRRALVADDATWGSEFTFVAIHGDLAVQVGLANRPGLFATKARKDYFLGLAREFGDLCEAAAAARELESGPHRYAAALGLLDGDENGLVTTEREPEAPPAAPASAASSTGSTGSIASAGTLAGLLGQLEEAFRGGLITREERDAKRAEILRRF